MAVRARMSSPAIRLSMWPLRPMVTTCGCSTSNSWSGTAFAMRCWTASRWSASDCAQRSRPSSRTWQTRVGASTSMGELEIDGLPVNGVERLADRLVERRMGMNGVDHGIDRGFGFHGRDGFGDQLIAVGAYDMDAENLTEFGIANHLYEAFVVAQNGRLRGAYKRELADLHIVALLSVR